MEVTTMERAAVLPAWLYTVLHTENEFGACSSSAKNRSLGRASQKGVFGLGVITVFCLASNTYWFTPPLRPSYFHP